jgi:hypothetical protein
LAFRLVPSPVRRGLPGVCWCQLWHAGCLHQRGREKANQAGSKTFRLRWTSDPAHHSPMAWSGLWCVRNGDLRPGGSPQGRICPCTGASAHGRTPDGTQTAANHNARLLLAAQIGGVDVPPRPEQPTAHWDHPNSASGPVAVCMRNWRWAGAVNEQPTDRPSCIQAQSKGQRRGNTPVSVDAEIRLVRGSAAAAAEGGESGAPNGARVWRRGYGRGQAPPPPVFFVRRRLRCLGKFFGGCGGRRRTTKSSSWVIVGVDKHRKTNRTSVIPLVRRRRQTDSHSGRDEARPL